MKKAIAWLAALATVASLTVTAFAQDIQPREDLAEGLYLLADADSGVAADGLLTPGETYSFGLQLVTEQGGEKQDITDELMQDNKITLTTQEGRTALESCRVVEQDGKYYLQVVTKAGWPTEQQRVTYDVNYIQLSDYSTVYTTEVSFLVGYATLPNGALSSDVVVVDPANPVITAEQFATLDEMAGGDKVTFAYGDWMVSVRLVEQKDTNMLSNSYGIKEIVTKFQDQEFKFVTFPAGPTFDLTATVTIDMGDEAEDFDSTYYLYRYANGKLSLIENTYDPDNESISFQTNQLGRFVVTNKKLADGTVIVPGQDTGDNGQTGGNGSTTNPGTGSGDVIGIAVALAVVSLTAAGALALKKTR